MTEFITCTQCKKTLQIPEQYLGETVQCPECGHQFTATAESVTSHPKPATAAAGSGSKRWAPEPGEDDYPRRRQRDFDDDEDSDELDVSRGIRSRLRPHRGGLVMSLGLISLVGGWAMCLPVVIGPIAWIMAQADLRAMRDGEMDPSGESMVRTGQVCGIISTIILILSLGVIGLVIVAAVLE
jgi:predicted RNA-binding Zn-ribbon protein involved in translation (DUF1610 family)